LLTQSYRPEERFKVQGLNELLVFSCQATASLSAGIMLSLFGWNGLLILSFCIVLIFVLFNQGVKFIGKDKPKLRTL
jgi:hypothetical protein